MLINMHWMRIGEVTKWSRQILSAEREIDQNQIIIGIILAWDTTIDWYRLDCAYNYKYNNCDPSIAHLYACCPSAQKFGARIMHGAGGEHYIRVDDNMFDGATLG
jgi:hypothetical protein